MLSKTLQDDLSKIKDLEVKFNQPLKEYTTFQVGGPTEVFIIPHNINALQQTLKVINHKEIPIFILGKGSNIIVSDNGFEGVVIWMDNLDQVEVNNNKLIAQTGATLEKLANKALEAELTGLEFASGIPGSIGGALYMNAGAYGGEIKDVIKEVTCLNYQGEKLTLPKEELNLDYRESIFQNKNLIAVKALFELKSGNKKKIKTNMEELEEKRWSKQPMEMPSAGSIFKRPENHYAGALIEEAGLKGLRVGDAQVSTKHAGFIVNLGKASAQDIKELIENIKEKVYQKSGVKLETEPKFIGEFDNS